MTNKPETSGVTIGDVIGGITNSIIAGRDIRDVTVTIGGHPVAADKDPEVDDLKQLLLDIQTELNKIAAERDALSAVSPSAALLTEGIKLNVSDAANTVLATTTPDKAPSVEGRLKEAGTMMAILLKAVEGASHGIEETGKALQPLANMIAPLVDKLAVAALWAARLWSGT